MLDQLGSFAAAKLSNCILVAACACVTGASDSMHSRGGLHTLFSMVLGGLVAATPHMVAATVMALARLLYEFAGPLEYMVDDLLPAVLALLRTKSREIVKAVLGFVKVRTHSPPPAIGSPSALQCCCCHVAWSLGNA